MDEHHHQVTKWLESFMAAGALPSFEVSERTLEVLFTLMKQSQRQETKRTIIIEDLVRRRKEYVAEVSRISQPLTALGIQPDSLSSHIRADLECLTELALELDLKEMSKTNYLLGLSELSETVDECRQKQLEIKRQKDELMAKAKAALVQSNTLKQVYARLGEHESSAAERAQQRSHEITFFHTKSHEYRQQLDVFQAELRQRGLQPGLYHDTLVAQAKELDDRKQHLGTLKSRVNTYHSLPPDVNLARVRLEQLRQEVESLESQLMTKIDLLRS